MQQRAEITEAEEGPASSVPHICVVCLQPPAHSETADNADDKSMDTKSA